jgi:hypothetical protein
MTQEQQHPITPPPELVKKWWDLIPDSSFDWKRQLCTQAAQWGADQRGAVNEAELQKARDEELKACLWHLESTRCNQIVITTLRSDRRPKPPSLKEQALEVVTGLEKRCDLQCDLACIRRALEALND